MICAYLLSSGAFKSLKEVLNFYAGKRTLDSNGVTIPSQRRYVDYFSTKISHSLKNSLIKLILKAIILELPSHVGFEHYKCHLQLSVIQHFHAPFQSKIYSTSWNDSKVVLKLSNPLDLSGNVKILFIYYLYLFLLLIIYFILGTSQPSSFLLFHFWVNTFFIDKNFSSELTHRISNRPPKDQEETRSN